MRVEVKNHQVYVGETGIGQKYGPFYPLLGGEVHYWRLAPEAWRACLARVKELGLQVVASYVCWDFHEFAPGQFDFTGRTDPRRNGSDSWICSLKWASGSSSGRDPTCTRSGRTAVCPMRPRAITACTRSSCAWRRATWPR